MMLLPIRSAEKGLGRVAKPVLNIGVDATAWHNRRGYGRHIRALLRALVDLDRGNEYTLFFDSDDRCEPAPDGCRAVALPSSKPTAEAASADGRRALADMWATSRALSARSFDVLLFPTVYSYVPVFSRARKILMIHDVIAETYPRLTTPGRAARWNWNLKVWLGRIQSDALVTVSNYSRRRIVEHFGVPADRVFVVGEAADPVFRRLDRPSLPAALRDSGIRPGPHTVVYVGGFGPHKNVDLLIDAFAACSSQPHLADAQLILVGERRKEVFHSAIDSIEALVRSYRIEDKTIFTGYLPDEDLAALLNLAGVLVLPSLMEGFGLPAVEAAACGCPVIATRESPLPELLGDGGIFITPRAADLRHALESLLSCDALRQRMGEAARQAAARLRWEDAARQMRDVIGRVMAP